MSIIELAVVIEKLKLEFLKSDLAPPTEMAVPFDTYCHLRADKDSLQFADTKGPLALNRMLLVNGVRIRYAD